MPTVALLSTCLVDQIHPEIGIATVRLLERAGFDVAFPAAQTCCGQPFFNSGYNTEAQRLARQTIEIFEPYEAVILPSGSCATMLRVEYAHLLHEEPEWAARAAALAAKTFELSEFLVRTSRAAEGANDPQSPSIPSDPIHTPPADSLVTYHDSCHMCRMLGLQDEPRTALAGAGVAITEMEESDRCCGFGGTFMLKMPEVSGAMTKEKLRLAAETGAKTLVTADPGCLMQMRRYADEYGIDVEHLAVVLDRIGDGQGPASERDAAS